jgi:hypothetical protein
MSLHTYVALYLCRFEERAIREFFQDYGLVAGAMRRELHLTIYEAPHTLPGLEPGDEALLIEANVDETRFMVMAPGGEVACPGIHPNERKVGLRLTRRNRAIPVIDELRLRFAALETADDLSDRRQSTARRSAFGAPRFQPHMTLLNPGSDVDSDLTLLGRAFRSEFQNLSFDRLEIRLRVAPPFSDDG